MLSSAVMLAANPAQWFAPSTVQEAELTDEEFDALGLILDIVVMRLCNFVQQMNMQCQMNM